MPDLSDFDMSDPIGERCIRRRNSGTNVHVGGEHGHQLSEFLQTLDAQLVFHFPHRDRSTRTMTPQSKTMMSSML